MGDPIEREEVTAEQFEVLKAMTGIEAVDFKRSRVGRHIFDTIDNDLERLDAELRACDPFDGPENQRIRNDIHVREMFTKFVEEAIASGNNAEKNLDAMSQPDY